jgi:hypothetical protein
MAGGTISLTRMPGLWLKGLVSCVRFPDLHSTEGAIGVGLVRISNVRLGLCVVSSMWTPKLNCIVLSHWSLTSFTFDPVSVRALDWASIPNIFCREISVNTSLSACSFYIIILVERLE